MNGQNNSTRCFICGHSNANILEVHHAVPQRLGGSDLQENTYSLCGSCHNAVEEIYDDDFYRRLGVAVDEAKGEKIGEQRGKTLDPDESVDRELPPDSDHINTQNWFVNISVEDVIDATNGEYTGLEKDIIEEHAEEILEQHELEVESKWEHIEKYEDFQEYAEGMGEEEEPAVNFRYEHGDVLDNRVIIVDNRERSYGDASPNINRRVVEETRYYGYGEDAEYREKSYPSFYRLHCSYCHRVYTQHQHSDLARHLRLQHGIEKPYSPTDEKYTRESYVPSFVRGDNE